MSRRLWAGLRALWGEEDRNSIRCCETTARDAFIRDYRVFFVADATAAANEELHVASLKNLAYGFAYIIDTKALCQTFKYRIK